MKAKPYKLIFTLLIVSVLSVLVLQAFWIRNFYLQKKEQLDQSVYLALEQVGTKLRQGESLRQISREIRDSSIGFVREEESTLNSRENSITTHVISIKKAKLKGSDVTLDSLKKWVHHVAGPMNSNLSGRPSLTGVYSINNDPKKEKEWRSEKDKLIDQMIFEFKVMDGGETNKDSLNQIIKRVLTNKGLFFPFEFALKKIDKNKTEVIAQSQGFDKEAESLVTDLSLGKVFNNHKFIYLQIPGQRDVVFSSMKNNLLLSVVFSLIIIAVFYYVMRLILTQKKLSEIRNDFVNNMTHELKTPIATISLAIDAMNNPLIKNDELRYADYTRILKEENKKLNSHVERVLQMAMLDKGELKLDKQLVDPQVLLQKAIESYQLQIKEKRAQINFVQSEEAIKVEGDAFHLQNAFANLIDNALKYSAEHCRIDISVIKLQDVVYIHFVDNGIGIAASEQARVFDKFYRVQGGNLHDVKGFGLGLSYVRSIVEAQGGSIELKSEKDKGSEFVIWFKSA